MLVCLVAFLLWLMTSKATQEVTLLFCLCCLIGYWLSPPILYFSLYSFIAFFQLYQKKECNRPDEHYHVELADWDLISWHTLQQGLQRKLQKPAHSLDSHIAFVHQGILNKILNYIRTNMIPPESIHLAIPCVGHWQLYVFFF